MFFSRESPRRRERRKAADNIYWIESVKEGDQDQDGNAFEIFDDENSEDDM